MHTLIENERNGGGLYWSVSGLSKIYDNQHEAADYCNYLNGGPGKRRDLARIKSNAGGNDFMIGDIVKLFRWDEAGVREDWEGSLIVGKRVGDGEEWALFPEDYELC